MPSRAYTSLLRSSTWVDAKRRTLCVNALTGLYLIATKYVDKMWLDESNWCQCPHGLIPHCYVPVSDSVLTAIEAACQCPHGLIPHCYTSCPQHDSSMVMRVNALTGLYLIATLNKLYRSVGYIFVSMPSRAYTSLLQYPFKNLGFMRFPEPVFAGICQNILTVAHFHAC